MPDIEQARQTLLARILEGGGEASRAQRRSAFDNSGLAGPLAALVDTVARNAHAVADADIAAAQASGLSEDQIFEIVICAAIGEATRQHDAALAALDAACGKA